MQEEPKLIEQLFFEVSDKYFQEHNGYRCLSERGIFSYAATVWIGILQRLSGNSLQKAMVSLLEQLKAGEPPIIFKQETTKKIRTTPSKAKYTWRTINGCKTSFPATAERIMAVPKEEASTIAPNKIKSKFRQEKSRFII